jgi:hypothetical protein
LPGCGIFASFFLLYLSPVTCNLSVPSRTSCPSWLKGFAVAFAFGFAIGVAFDFAVGVAFLWPMACCLLPIASSLFGFPPLSSGPRWLKGVGVGSNLGLGFSPCLRVRSLH